MTWLRWLSPWAFGLVILWALFARIDPAGTGAALARCSIGLYLLCSLGFIGIWLLLDALALATLIPEDVRAPSLATLASMRASTYPLFAINFHLASASLVREFARELAIPITRATGMMLGYYAVDLLALSSLALLGSLTLGGEDLYVRGPLLGVLGLGLAVVTCVRAARSWLRQRPAFRVLGEMPLQRLGWLLLLRSSLHASFAVFIVVGLSTFGVALPWAAAAARTPLVLAVGALPISVGSLGTAQAAIVYFFRSFAPAEELLAFGLAYTFTLLVLRVPIGGIALIFRRRAPTELAETRA